MFGLFKKKQPQRQQTPMERSIVDAINNKGPKDLSQYTRDDIGRLAAKYNGNVVGGFLVEQGIITESQVTANGYMTDPGKHLICLLYTSPSPRD